jgi:hypothetical protein
MRIGASLARMKSVHCSGAAFAGAPRGQAQRRFVASPMRPVAVIRFSPSEGPGRFGEWLDAQRRPWTLVALDRGDDVPDDPSAYAGSA